MYLKNEQQPIRLDGLLFMIQKKYPCLPNMLEHPQCTSFSKLQLIEPDTQTVGDALIYNLLSHTLLFWKIRYINLQRELLFLKRKFICSLHSQPLPLTYLERRLIQTQPTYKLIVESVLIRWEDREEVFIPSFLVFFFNNTSDIILSLLLFSLLFFTLLHSTFIFVNAIVWWFS